MTNLRHFFREGTSAGSCTWSATDSALVFGGDACFHNASRSRSRQSRPSVCEATAVPSESALGTSVPGIRRLAD
jgi:hypothetical protein